MNLLCSCRNIKKAWPNPIWSRPAFTGLRNAFFPDIHISQTQICSSKDNQQGSNHTALLLNTCITKLRAAQILAYTSTLRCDVSRHVYTIVTSVSDESYRRALSSGIQRRVVGWSKQTFRRHISPPSSVSNNRRSKKPARRAFCLFHAGFLLDLLFNPEEGDDIPPKYRLTFTGIQGVI
jgi:hypothetical protein